MAADTRVHTDTVDDLLSVESLGLSVSVELVEVAATGCKVCVCEQLDSLSLSRMSDQDRNVLRLLSGTALLGAGSLEQQVSKLLSDLLLVTVSAYNDSARVQVVAESLRLAQELRAEDELSIPTNGENDWYG